jgi:RNA polymerase sigma-70 factor (ECF subfamily)
LQPLKAGARNIPEDFESLRLRTWVLAWYLEEYHAAVCEIGATMFERFHRFVSSLARKRFPDHLRSKLDPEDVVQETLLKAQKAGAALAGRTDREARLFLRKVFTTTLLDQIRIFDRGRRCAALERSIHVGSDQSSTCLEDWLAASQTSPSQGAARNEQHFRLSRALASLPLNQRQAVELRYLKRCSLEETARSMGITSGAVAGLVRRGLEALREHLDE